MKASERLRNKINGISAECDRLEGKIEKKFDVLSSELDRVGYIAANASEIIDKNKIFDLNFSDEILRYSIRIKEPYKKLHSFLLKVVRKHVIQHANVQFNELKGQKIICEIFEVLHSDPERFLHGSTKKTYLKQESDNERARVISDYISGMTDEYATKLYEKMFCPRKGSVFDRL